MSPARGWTLGLAAITALMLVLTACGTAAENGDSPVENRSSAQPTAQSSPATGHGAGEQHGADDAEAAPVRRQPLRAGERRVTVRMPQDYTPDAPTGVGTDDYRCFLLDPKLPNDQFITGFNVLPGNPDVVHHVILFRVPTDQVAAAEKKDDSTRGQGWTCFGDTGLGGGPAIDDAPWLGAWAPGGSEQRYGRGFGVELDRGSRVIMQVHYNLLAGRKPDRSGAELRLAPVSRRITPLQTRLLPGPVELPCRPAHSDGALCQRPAALADVKERFGQGPGSTADLLHLLCGPTKPGPVQSCERMVARPETVRGVAGHMHLLGKSIRIEVNPGGPRARTLLDVPVWDFDDQGSRPIKPAVLQPGDRLKVTCEHTQALRDRLPAFEGMPDKYVVWGEGTTDEMCLGLLLVSRP